MSEEYLHSMSGSDGYRRYGVCEAGGPGGYVIYWRTLSGEKLHPVKSLGEFETINAADEALLAYAREKRMKRWVESECKGLIAEYGRRLNNE